jgi:hypothetical protein
LGVGVGVGVGQGVAQVREGVGAARPRVAGASWPKLTSPDAAPPAALRRVGRRSAPGDVSDRFSLSCRQKIIASAKHDRIINNEQ